MGLRISKKAHREWVNEALSREDMAREATWSEAVAVGSLSFVNKLKGDLGFKAAHREVTELGASYALGEEREAYGPNFGGESVRR
jgi:hypothetical protein